MSALERLDSGAPEQAAEALRRCCGASRWVEAMVQARPFLTRERLLAEGERAWASTGPEDWLEAFRHHPKIGDISKLRERFASTAAWSSQEQGGVAGASEEVLQGLAEGNREYEERFGFIFIVCATGLGAGELLERLRRRLGNTREEELRIAAAEQGKILRLRLEKLAGEP